MAQDTTIGATLQSPLSVRKWKISNHYFKADAFISQLLNAIRRGIPAFLCEALTAQEKTKVFQRC
jgi:hypothetical protein